MLKKRFEKILILIIISILMINFIGTNVVMAATTTSTTDVVKNADAEIEKLAKDTTALEKEKKAAENMDNTSVWGGILDGVVGIATYGFKLIFLGVGGAAQYLATIVGDSAGSTEEIAMLTPEDILFNKIAITDINFFNTDTFGATNKKLSGENNPIQLLKQNVAKWYMTLRAIAIIILLAVLIYIGIRMAMSSVASEKAEYKKMLTSWVVSLALVFLLHYIIIFVIIINNSLVNILGSLQIDALQNESGNFGKYLEQLFIKSFAPSVTVGWTAAILYVCVVVLILVFLIMYIKRMITIAFLILISPIITITYSIDKVGDGKAQAFSAWIKEFLHNVLIQPFHCLIYLAFTSVAVNLLDKTASLGATMLVVLTMFFILESEKLIKKIFGIDSESTGSGLGTALVLSNAFGKLKSSKDDKKGGSAPTNGSGSVTPSRVRPRPTSNVATNNMNAVTPLASTVPTGTPTSGTTRSGLATHSPYSSESLSEKLSGGPAHVDDYDSLMGLDDDKNERLSANVSGGQAHVDDYNSLMGLDDDNNTQTQPKVNRVYGIPGTLQPQTAQAAPQTNKVYGWLGTQPSGKSDMGDTLKDYANSAWKGVKAVHSASSGLAGAMLGGVFAGMAGGNMADTIAAMSTGASIENKATNKLSEKKQQIGEYLTDRNIRNKEQELANNFSEYKNGGQYQPTDINQAMNYLQMTKEQVSNIPSQPEKQYVQSLHATRDALKEKYQGAELDDKVIETLEKVVYKEIQPEP